VDGLSKVKFEQGSCRQHISGRAMITASHRLRLGFLVRPGVAVDGLRGLVGRLGVPVT